MRYPSSFWLLVFALLTAAGGFWRGFERKQAALTAPSASLETGDIVTVAAIADGDSVIVTKNGARASVRLLGIKVLPDSGAQDAADRFSKEATDAVRRLTSDQSLRVLLNSPPKDKHGRFLAQLFVDDQDVGLTLVRQGLALVYTVYPFPGMGLYLQEQATARAAQRGMWADPTISKRAALLIHQWQSQGP